MEKITKKRIGAAIVALGMATSIYFAPHIVNAQNNTGAELSSDRSFAVYLEQIEEERNISFQNKELYEVLSKSVGAPLTIEKLRSITTLNLDITLNNQDLSDLKYLINLERLYINGNNVNCEDLKYNQNLSFIFFSDCHICNTQELPNTITRCVFDSTVSDEAFVIPYNTNEVCSYGTSLNKLYFKNPSALKSFTFSGYGFLDLENLSNCSNLESLEIRTAPNIRHPEYLSRLSAKEMVLDEFCTLWVGNNVIKSLPIDESSKATFMNINNQLSDIINRIITPDMSEEEKINQIILYVINQIEYDYDALGETKEASAFCTQYNLYPLSYALSQNDGVCVGYATLFTALANRAGLTSYQPDSINHTWNMIKTIDDTTYRGYDLTMLDHTYTTLDQNGEIVYDQNTPSAYYIEAGDTSNLVYYDFDLSSIPSESYQTDIEVKDITVGDIKTGYLNQNTNKSQREDLIIRLKVLYAELVALSALTIGSIALKGNNKKEQPRKPVIVEPEPIRIIEREEQKQLKYTPRRSSMPRKDNKQVIMGKRR